MPQDRNWYRIIVKNWSETSLILDQYYYLPAEEVAAIDSSYDRELYLVKIERVTKPPAAWLRDKLNELFADKQQVDEQIALLQSFLVPA